MKNIIHISFILGISIALVQCRADEKNAEETISYPKTLAFKEEGNNTFNEWKGGVLQNKTLDQVNSLIGNECLNFFNSETDAICKATKLVFLDNQNVKFSYGNVSELTVPYEFINDTLKLSFNNTKLAIGVGNRSQVKIYGTLKKYHIGNSSSCGGDEFLKQDFYKQYFFNAHNNHKLPISSPSQMGTDDYVYFYVKEYILK